MAPALSVSSRRALCRAGDSGDREECDTRFVSSLARIFERDSLKLFSFTGRGEAEKEKEKGKMKAMVRLYSSPHGLGLGLGTGTDNCYTPPPELACSVYTRSGPTQVAT